MDKARFLTAPCYICGYNGPGYFQPETHPCAKEFHEKPKTYTDGIVQGRREAAEAYCAIACHGIDSRLRDACRIKGPCSKGKAILGTASDEKVDKGDAK